MSGIVLSASVRQNLLSLQSTADLLATTQSRLSTGKKVNTALDNPTNFFTAQSLDGRASDISNLLDGIGNGVQVLQAANAGITSLSKLVDTAKSIANQALQTTVGYSTKSNVSATVAGATALDLRGTTSFTSATAFSNVLYSGAAGGVTAAGAGLTLGGLSGALTGVAVLTNDTSSPPAITAATLLNDAPTGSSLGLAAATVADGDTFTVNGHSITFKAGAAPLAAAAPTGYGIDSGASSIATDGAGNSLIYIGASATTSTATVGDVLRAIDLASGVRIATVASGAATVATNSGQTVSTVAGSGAVSLQTSTGGDLTVSGKADFLKAFGLTAALGSGITTVGATRTTSAATAGNLIADGSTLNVNGKTITFRNAPTPLAANVASGSGVSGNIVTDGSGNSTVFLQLATITDTLKAIDIATGVRTVSIASGAATVATATGQTNSSVNVSGVINISTGTAADLAITGTGNALSVLGLTFRAWSHRRHRHRYQLHGFPHCGRRRHQRQVTDLHLLQWRHGGQCHLRRRHRWYRQDARSAQHPASGEQPDRDARLGRQADDLRHQRLRFLDPRVGGGRWRDRRFGDHCAFFLDPLGTGHRQFGAVRPQQPGEAVQRHSGPDHHHGPGCFVQRRQPARRRPAQTDVQRDRQVHVEHHRR